MKILTVMLPESAIRPEDRDYVLANLDSQGLGAGYADGLLHIEVTHEDVEVFGSDA